MDKKIFVIGRTTPSEVYVVSIREFILNEYLIITDKNNNFPVGEIIQTFSYSSIYNNTFNSELNIISDLEALNIDMDSKINIGVLRIIDELQIPINTGAEVRVPDFSEVEKLLMSGADNNNGLLLGVTQGTSNLNDKLPKEYKDKCCLFNNGKVIEQNGVPFLLNYYAFKEYPHIGLFGGSGSGKTHGLRVITEEIMRHRIPGIAFDLHYELDFSKKMSSIPEKYSSDFSKNHEILTIGKEIGINFTELTTPELISLLAFVGDLSQPMRGAIEALHEFNDSYTTLFNRAEMIKMAFDNNEKPEQKQEDLSPQAIMLYSKYKNKIAGSGTLQAIMWRLEALNKMNIFGNDLSKVEACMMKRKIAVIRSSSNKVLKVFSSYVLNKLYKRRRGYQDGTHNDKFPPFFIIGDEAHNLAPNNERMNPTKAILREISQEARKYGVFLILGTQRPSLLDSTVVSQLNTKIIFRTSIKSDMEMIKTETNLNDLEFSKLPTLSSGNAFVSSATLSKNFYIRFRCTKTMSPHQKHPFSELDDFGGVNEELTLALKQYLPIASEMIPSIHSEIISIIGKNINIDEILQALNGLVQNSEIGFEKTPFGNRYIPLK